VQPLAQAEGWQGSAPGAAGNEHANGQPPPGMGAQVKSRQGGKLTKFGGQKIFNALGVLVRVQNKSAGSSFPHLALV